MRLFDLARKMALSTSTNRLFYSSKPALVTGKRFSYVTGENDIPHEVTRQLYFPSHHILIEDGKVILNPAHEVFYESTFTHLKMDCHCRMNDSYVEIFGRGEKSFFTDSVERIIDLSEEILKLERPGEPSQEVKNALTKEIDALFRG